MQLFSAGCAQLPPPNCCQRGANKLAGLRLGQDGWSQMLCSHGSSVPLPLYLSPPLGTTHSSLLDSARNDVGWQQYPCFKPRVLRNHGAFTAISGNLLQLSGASSRLLTEIAG